MLDETGLAAKAGGYTIEPGAYAVLPKRVGPVAMPLARRVNRAVEAAPTCWWSAPRLCTADGPPRTAGVRTLVTGGGGFLGSHLVERLEAEGHDVVVARRRDTT